MLVSKKRRDSSYLYRLVEQRYLEDIAKVCKQNGTDIKDIWQPDSPVRLTNFEYLSPHPSVFPTFYNKLTQKVEIIMFSRNNQSNPLAKKVKTRLNGENRSAQNSDKSASASKTRTGESSEKTSSANNSKHRGERKLSTPNQQENESSSCPTPPVRLSSSLLNRRKSVSLSLNQDHRKTKPTEIIEKEAESGERNETKLPEKPRTPNRKRKVLKRRSKFTVNESWTEIDRMVRNPFANEVWFRKAARVLKKPDAEEEEEEEKNVTQEDIDNMVRRLVRPTVSSKNRVKKRHLSQEPRKQKRVTFETYEDDVNRFSGKRHMTVYEIEDVIDRLSEIPVRVPENCRIFPDSVKSDVGILGSYRWQGILKS